MNRLNGYRPFRSDSSYHMKRSQGPSASFHQKQAQRHDNHAADEAIEAVVPFAIGPAGGQQFVQADVDHDTGHPRKKHAHHLRRNGTGFSPNEKPQSEISNNGTDRLG